MNLFKLSIIRWNYIAISSLIIFVPIFLYISINLLDLKNISRPREDLSSSWLKATRSGSCFIKDHGVNSFPNFCTENLRPLLVLWGDSHAASLYPGFANLQNFNKFGIAQFTTAGCPPILKIDGLTARGSCDSINESIILNIVKLQPKYLVVNSAYWVGGNYLWKNENELLARFKKTLQVLKSLKLKNTAIIIIGPIQQWAETSPNEILKIKNLRISQALGMREYPQYINFFTDLDIKLEKMTKELGITYISILREFCNLEGCLLVAGGGAEIGLVQIDSGHLSEFASIKLIKKLQPLFMEY